MATPRIAIVPKRGRWFTVREAAQYLGTSESRVRTLIARGELVATRRESGRLSGVYEADCDAFQEQIRQRCDAAVASADVDARVRALITTPRFS